MDEEIPEGTDDQALSPSLAATTPKTAPKKAEMAANRMASLFLFQNDLTSSPTPVLTTENRRIPI
jgi:hypothetical protein